MVNPAEIYIKDDILFITAFEFYKTEFVLCNLSEIWMIVGVNYESKFTIILALTIISVMTKSLNIMNFWMLNNRNLLFVYVCYIHKKFRKLEIQVVYLSHYQKIICYSYWDTYVFVKTYGTHSLNRRCIVLCIWYYVV